MRYLKVLEASSGQGLIFNSSDNLYSYKLSIVGTANSTIHGYFNDKVIETNAFYLKLRCNDWGSAQVSLLCKSNKFEDDLFSETGDTFTSNTLDLFYY